MSEAKKKIIAGFLLLPAAIWLLGFAPPAVLLAVVLLIGGLAGSFEFSRLVFRPEDHAEIVLTVGASVVLCVLAQTGEGDALFLGLSAVFITVTAAMLFTKDFNAAFPRAATIITGAIYTGAFAGLVVAMRRMEPGLGGTKLVIAHFALTWANDAGAFFVGSRYGKTKLWPAVSAGKTWEGAFGGAASSVLAGLVIAAASPVWLLRDGLILGGLFAVATPIGDLIESAMKRSAGVKDSGFFLPGHGGALDRIDSILFTAPIMYFYALLVGPLRVG
ncbi:MAG: phosphatidate cytidylyltransferase [Deltaproteobacteria bacterium]|nr:phosphatidate cytidylyltransferase [Deltaproteobacteria bacterium]